MNLSDLVFIFQWWMVFLGIGLVFLPLTVNIFPNFFDRGYIFAKVLGIIIVSYTVFLLGIVRILPFTTLTIVLVTGFFAGINILILKKYWRATMEQLNNRAIVMFILEELLFLIALAFWSFIRAHQPDINGLEKFMDFGFINSILRSEYFPPKDMWFTPFSINYYYFGHLTTAILTKLSGIPSFITYNLMLSTIFAFTFTGAFSIGASLASFLKQKARGDTTGRVPDSAHAFGSEGETSGALAGRKGVAGPRAILGGLITAFLVSFAGNLHSLYAFFKPYVNENPVPFWQLAFSPQAFPNAYWYPNATRFIHNTIHEFPLYSFVVSDLHGHVLDIPVVLLTIAVLLSLAQSAKFNPANGGTKFKIFNFKLQFFTFNFSLLTLLTFLLAIMYMTNVWDGIIYLLLSALIIFYLKKKSILHTLYSILFLLVGFFIFSLPFSLFFKPFASGIGILCVPQLLTDIGRIGPFLFEPDHCQKSSFWQLFILYGFFYFWIMVFIILNFGNWKLIRNWKLEIRNLTNSDIFVLILILFSTLLIVIPEFIYVKDIYPAHYRANTMFKLVYQAFIMLSIASAYIILRTVLSIMYYVSSINIGKKILTTCYILLSTILLILVMIYPYLAINSYYGDLKTYHGLDGIKYLQRSYPNDYEGMLWISKNIKGQPVILEAQGDSYTDYGRVSSNTGLPTVLGWTVHEWLWRGSYDIPSPRISEVQTLYESDDLDLTYDLIRKYNIELVFIGELENQKYANLNEDKFKNLGKIIFEKNQTKIYQL